MNFSAVILAGGESRRMGSDKAWIAVGGQPLIAQTVATARESGVEDIFISGRAGQDYSALRCPVLLDLEPGFGPLGGIERALHAARLPLVLVLAVDMPNMTAAFLRKLMSRCDALTGAVPKLNGEIEPLAAVYPKRCHVLAYESVLRSRHSATAFAEACLRERAVRALTVPAADARCFDNWNRPSDVPGRERKRSTFSV